MKARKSPRQFLQPQPYQLRRIRTLSGRFQRCRHGIGGNVARIAEIGEGRDRIRHRRGRDALATYLTCVRDEAYDVSTGLCLSGGIGAYEHATILDQSALVQLFTVSAWPRERCATLC